MVLSAPGTLTKPVSFELTETDGSAPGANVHSSWAPSPRAAGTSSWAPSPQIRHGMRFSSSKPSVLESGGGGSFSMFVHASDRTRLMRHALVGARRGKSHVELRPAHSAPSRLEQLVYPSPCSSPVGTIQSQMSVGSVIGILDTWGCTCNVVNLIVGNGLFTLAYGFKLGGWVSGPVVVLTTALFCYTGTLLGYSLEVAEGKGYQQPDYGVVGELAFGVKFRGFFTFFCVGECFLMTVFLLVFIADIISTPLNVPTNLLVFAVGAGGTLVSLVPKQFVALVAVVGMGLTISCAGAVVGCGLALDTWAKDQSMVGTDGFQGAMYTVSFVGIAVADHPVFPGVYHQVNAPSDFFRGMRYGHTLFGVIALILSVVAYMTYGSAIRPVALNNMSYDISSPPREITNRSWIGVTANFLIAFRSLLVAPAFIRPVAGLATDILFGPVSSKPAGGPRRGVRVLLIALSFGFCACAASLLADFLPQIEALTGSLFKSMNALILPCLSYRRLCSEQLADKPFESAFLLVVIIGAILYGVLGTYCALGDIMNGRIAH